MKTCESCVFFGWRPAGSFCHASPPAVVGAATSDGDVLIDYSRPHVNETDRACRLHQAERENAA